MNLLFEAKYAVRRLRKAPGYTAMSLAVISLSIALSIVVLSLVYHLTLKPMGFPGMENWQAVRSFTPNGWRGGGTDSTIYWGLSQSELNTIVDIGAFDNPTVLLDDGVATYSLAARRITPNLIQASGEAPLLGRLLSANDAEFDSVPVVMLSFTAWQHYYGADSNIIGKQTRIDGELRTIIGVLREDSELISGAFWLPLTKADLNSDTGHGQLQTIVRLREGATTKLANQEIAQLVQNLKAEFSGRISDTVEWRLHSLNNLLFQSGEPIFLSLSTVTPILIILACLSVGTLLFARILEQHGQLAIRQAVGSSPWQTSSQASIESLVLCLGGCVVGIGIAFLALANINYLMDSYWGNHIQGAENPASVQLNTPILLLALVEACLIWMVSGFLPAISASRLGINATLSNASKGATGGGGKTSTCLIATQVILGCFLLIVSGTYAYQNIYQTYLNRGIDTEGLSTATVVLDGHYSNQGERMGYLNTLQNALASIAGLNKVAYTTALPDMYSPPVTVTFAGGEDTSESAEQVHVVTHVSDNYFTSVNLPILQGRIFDQQDTSDTEAVVIVDEFFARKFWPDESAIGKRVRLKSVLGSDWHTVVGVSAHVRRQVADNRFTVYRPLRQQVPSFPGELLLLIDHDQPLPVIRRELAATASGINRNIPLTNILPIEAYQIATWGWRMVQSHVFAWIYSVVLFLVALSIFAVLSRTIVQRIRDIGVRRAMGSSNRNIMVLYIRRGFLLVIAGSIIGTGLALLSRNWLINIPSDGDFPNFVADVSIIVVTTLALFILIATYLPARKAIALEPGDALRYE